MNTINKRDNAMHFYHVLNTLHLSPITMLTKVWVVEFTLQTRV